MDGASDQYALACIAFELLAGAPAFAGTSAEIFARRLGGPPPSLAAVRPDLPAAADAVLARALAPVPGARYASATAFADALAAALAPRAAAEVPAASHDGTGGRAPHGRADGRPRGRRAVVGVATAAALLAGAAAAWRGAQGVARAAPVGPTMLAVLPFDHAGPAEQAPFTDGLTDAVTAKLGALPGLAVIDRHSAAQYRATTKPARQVGAELGVPYLVEGVVRWARDAAGAWRAQVTPTLVDAKAGTTRWTGEPVVITPSDPFTAQTQVATRVAEALQVALRPADRAALARRMTDDPEALAAYQRGLAIIDAIERGGVDSPYEEERMAAEFARAVGRDSTFTEAWGQLASERLYRAMLAPGDRAAEARARATLAAARRHAPDDPDVLASLATLRANFDHDTGGSDALLRRAVARIPDESRRLAWAAGLAWGPGAYDSAYALRRRAAVLDPRSMARLQQAGMAARKLRRWADARRYADAMVALDSADESGWQLRLAVPWAQGDTLAMQREAARVLARFPHPSVGLLNAVAYAGTTYGLGYVSRSGRELGVATLLDSVDVLYDTKADVFLRLGDVARARIYSDSVRRLLAGRRLGGPNEGYLLRILAFAQANLGDTAAARRTLARGLARDLAAASQADSLDVLSSGYVLGTYARLGEAETAVRWMEASLAAPVSGPVWSTARAYAIHAKLLVLHGTPAFARFLRAHPE